MPRSTLSQLACPRCIWSAVSAIVLKVAIAFVLANCFLAVEHAPSVTQAYLGVGGSPLEEALRHAQELSEQDAQQSFGFSLPLVVDPLLSSGQHRLFLFWSPLGWVVLSIALFFPRRFLLIHPSTDDDPFLNYSSL